MGGVVDVFTDVFDTVLDFIDDVVDDIVEFTIDIGQDVLDFATDVASDLFVGIMDVTETLLNPFGVFDFTGIDRVFKTGRNAILGTEYLLHAGISGDWKAFAQLGVLAASIVFAVYDGGTTFVSTISAIYTIYGVTINLEGIQLSRLAYARMLKSIQTMKNSMALAFVNSWINGSMNMWMAGGMLYDSPKAGDILFNPTGSLKTTKFLGLQDANQNKWYQWNFGKYHNFQKKVYGNMAGDVFFSVSPLAQRI